MRRETEDFSSTLLKKILCKAEVYINFATPRLCVTEIRPRRKRQTVFFIYQADIFQHSIFYNNSLNNIEQRSPNAKLQKNACRACSKLPIRTKFAVYCSTFCQTVTLMIMAFFLTIEETVKSKIRTIACIAIPI